MRFALTLLLAASLCHAEDWKPPKFHPGDAPSGSEPPPVNGMPAAPENPDCTMQGFAVGGQPTQRSSSQFCSGLSECEAWCCAACTFDVTKKTAEAYDGSAACVNAPQGGPGMIPPDSSDLVDLEKALRGSKLLVFSKDSTRGTQEVVKGLKALNDALAAAPERKDHAFKLEVNNCYRRAIGDHLAPFPKNGDPPDGNAEAVCGMTFWLMHRENGGATKAQKKAWEANAANVWGMTWPGATPHSGGFACDLVLRDEHGKRCFNSTAGPDTNSPTCAVDQQTAVQILSHAAGTKAVGAVRLDYEAWHFEWGADRKDVGCRCKGAECDQFWPVTGNKSQCP
jgi:hypothetical protein